MCRTGGRRCPSNHDAIARAARNAQRRAKYATERAVQGKSYTPRVVGVEPTTNTHLRRTPPKNNPIAVGPAVPTTVKVLSTDGDVGVRPRNATDDYENRSPLFYEPDGDYRIVTGTDTARKCAANRIEYDPPGVEEITLSRPLVLPVATSAEGRLGSLVKENWRNTLSQHYGGLTGDRLSDAIVQDGYDGIVVREPDWNSDDEESLGMVVEMIDLRTWEPEERDVGFEGALSVLSSKAVRKVSSYQDDEIGITVTNYDGDFVEFGHFSSKSLSGKPNWDKLNDGWAKKMGLPGDFNQRSDTKLGTRSGMGKDFTMRHCAIGDIEGDSLNQDENLAISSYTGSAYDTVNRTLVGSRPVDQSHIELIERLDRVTRAGGKQTRVVYRGTSLTSIQMDKEPDVGDDISFPTFQSTSSNPSVALLFGKTAVDDNRDTGVEEPMLIMEISTPEGISVGNVAGPEYEAEVILPRGARYVVVGKYKLDPKLGDGTVVQMVAVNSKGELLDGTNDDPTPQLPS